MNTISRIYVRLPNWVGDVCMSLPSLGALQATGIPLVICARDWARDLLDSTPKQDFLAMSGKILADQALVRAHRLAAGSGARGDRGLLLPDSLSSAAVFRLAGLPSAGYRDDGRSLLLHWPFSKPKTALHAVELWYHLTRRTLEKWGFSGGEPTPSAQFNLPLTQTHKTAAEAVLATEGLTDKPFVLIAPTATGLHKGRAKVWPGFDALTRTLQAQGYAVVMCPPKDEALQTLHNAPSAKLLPPLPLDAFAALTARAALVVCNDSGVSHLAAASAARQLTLFGVTNPQRTGPWSPLANYLGSETTWPSEQQVANAALALLNQVSPTTEDLSSVKSC